MLGMGLTLELADFSRVLRQPGAIGLGVLLQYTVMPLLGWAVGIAFCVAGPVRRRSRAGVLLSGWNRVQRDRLLGESGRRTLGLDDRVFDVASGGVHAAPSPRGSLGAVSTSTRGGLFISTAKVVLLPVGVGVVMRPLPASVHVVAPACRASRCGADDRCHRGRGARCAARRGDRVRPRADGCSRRDAQPGVRGRVPSDRCGARALVVVARTTSIEVGMQNSGLGAVLAQAHFANPLTVLPSAISAITHCILGSALAAWWSRRPPREVFREFHAVKTDWTPIPVKMST